MWCLGVWTITEPGKLLAFIKQPLVNKLEKRKKEYVKAKNKILEIYAKQVANCNETDRGYYETTKNNHLESIEETYDMFKKNMKLLNPIILCPVCMGSVHGFVCFSMYQPLSLWVIPVMIMTAGLNKLWHEKLF